MALEILVNTGSGNVLLPDGTMPLPEPILTQHQWHSPDNNLQAVLKILDFENDTYRITAISPRKQWVDPAQLQKPLALIQYKDVILPV